MYLAQTLKRQLLQQQKRLKSGLTKQVQLQREQPKKTTTQFKRLTNSSNSTNPSLFRGTTNNSDFVLKEHYQPNPIGALCRGVVGFMGGFMVFAPLGTVSYVLRSDRDALDTSVRLGLDVGICTGLLFAFPKTTLVGMGALYYNYKKAGLDKRKP